MSQPLKNQNTPFLGYTESVFSLLRKIPDTVFQNLLKQYITYGKKMKLVQWVFLAFAGIAVLHNFLILSDSYTSSYSRKDIMIGLLLLFLIPCFALIGILLIGQMGMRSALKKVCLGQNLPVRKTRKEFNQYVKTHIGGYGI